MSQIPTPSEQDVFRQLKDSILSIVKVGIPAKVESYNEQLQTITAIPVVALTSIVLGNNPTFKLEPIENIPVVVSKGLKGGLTVPLNKGDEVLLQICGSSFDSWFSGVDFVPANVLTSHSLHSAIAIPFVHSRVSAIKEINNSSTTLDYIESPTQVAKTVLTPSSAQLNYTRATSTSNLTLENDSVDLSYSSAGLGSKLTLKQKVNLSNTTQDLHTLIQDDLGQEIDLAQVVADLAAKVQTLATALSSATTTNAIIGLPCSMAPPTIAQATQVATDAGKLNGTALTIKGQLTTAKTGFSQLLE